MAALAPAESFFTSAVLFALVDLGIYRELADGPRTHTELHRATGGDAESLRAVLDGGVALKVLALDGTRYTADEAMLDALGRPDTPAYVGETVTFLHKLARPLLELATVVRTGRPAIDLDSEMPADAIDDHDSWSTVMTDAMDAYSRGRGSQLADRLDLTGVSTLLDVGGGPGTYSLALCQRNPRLRVTLVERPGPLAIAGRLAAERGMADRFTLVAADMFEYEAPRPFDAVLFSCVLHMVGTEASIGLLRRYRGMLVPGGRMIVQGQLLDDDRTAPHWPVLLNLCQRAVTPRGRNHSVAETAAWLREAGFEDPTLLSMSLWNASRCMVARRPATP
ncbi:MAG TPA: methyltransferase [Kofleriaceae bacterium]|nr:methyltransferase [Kofleriaceae bacterium]